MFKKVRPARPQPIGRAERTEEYVSTAKGRERRWRRFSTLPDEFQLSVAARDHRVFFTPDTRDFSRLATDWAVAGRTHAGILLAHQLSLRELILRFRALLLHDPFLDYTNQIL